MKSTVALILLVFCLAPNPALAHHSFASQFDSSKPVTLRGVVARLEWTNPHSWLYVDAKDEGGNLTHWQCELVSPNQLKRLGWSRDSVKVGDQLTVEGFRARNDENTCYARIVKTPDGKRVFGEEGRNQ